MDRLGIYCMLMLVQLKGEGECPGAVVWGSNVLASSQSVPCITWLRACIDYYALRTAITAADRIYKHNS